MSVILKSALESYQEMRDEFELYRHAAFLRASRELRGELLNAHGRALRIDPYSLFMGNAARATCYASEELIAWWAEQGRPTVAAFEAQWTSSTYGPGATRSAGIVSDAA